jgi:hypothetical protein
MYLSLINVKTREEANSVVHSSASVTTKKAAYIGEGS